MRRGAAAAVLVVTALSGTPVATAHSVLQSIDPADGARVPAAPTRVTLTFNESINPDFATVTLLDADKRNHAVGSPRVDGPRVTIDVADVPPGPQTVGYRVTSADGHVVQGSSRFVVAGGSVPPAPETGASTASTDDADQGDSGVDTALWVVAGLAVVLIGAAFVLARRKD